MITQNIPIHLKIFQDKSADREVLVSETEIFQYKKVDTEMLKKTKEQYSLIEVDLSNGEELDIKQIFIK